MNLVPEILAFADDLTHLRRDIHAHPEIGFGEHRTAALVAGLLAGWGIEVHRGIGGTGVVGLALAECDAEPRTGSGDFAEMLAHVPGAYLLLGQGPGAALHNPRYDFNDAATPIGASFLARLAEARLAA